MPLGPDKVRLQTVVDLPLAEKIRDLAKRMQLSESALVYALLERAVESEGWVIKAVTTSTARRLARLFGISGDQRAKLEQVDKDLEEFEEDQKPSKKLKE
jgi:plasmid maintenance system antidote protein VapI